MKKAIITIGREFGSGGRTIAKQLAERLGIPYYDREIIERTAEQTGFSEAFVREAEKRPTTSFLYNLYFDSQSLPLSDQVYIAESDVIRKVAYEGPCVIVGRCADYVLRERPGVLRTFIYAPLPDRVRRVKEEYGIETGNYESYIQKQDKARAAYYNHFTSGKWGYYRNFDLSINSALGVESVLDAIIRLYQGQ